jgi:hypothetical protein
MSESWERSDSAIPVGPTPINFLIRWIKIYVTFCFIRLHYRKLIFRALEIKCNIMKFREIDVKKYKEFFHQKPAECQREE